MIELTEQQQQALEAQQGEPPRVVNPRTQETYVLVPAALYDRMKELLEEEEELREVREMYPHVWQVMREDWEDPAMDVYDNYPPPQP
jgi:hypothetical protein